MKLDEKKILFLATGAYSGHSPFVPGTVGTLAGIPVCIIPALLAAYAGMATAALFIIGFIIFSVIIAQKAVTLLNEKDPCCIVIDEICGLMVALIGVQMNPLNLIGAFLLFRGFDILKPFPVNYIENSLPEGAGVVLDDVAAGMMANLVLRFIIFLW